LLQASWFKAQEKCCSVGMTLPVLSEVENLAWMNTHLRDGALKAFKEYKTNPDPSAGKQKFVLGFYSI
jgi:hypothetical protein